MKSNGRGAGRLRERLRFEARETQADDGYGNVESAWQEQFCVAAGITPLRGSETVIASRLADRQPVIITIRSNICARMVTPGWRAVDVRDETKVYNIHAAANFDQRDKWIDIMAEAGVPT